MDNKRWGKRFSTIFWWTFTILPLIAVLIEFVGFHLTFNSGIATAQELVDYQTSTSGGFATIFKKNLEIFSSYEISYLRVAFSSLFRNLGVNQFESSQYLGPLFAWMASVQVYHLMFDFFAWLPRLFHNWMDRWCVE